MSAFAQDRRQPAKLLGSASLLLWAGALVGWAAVHGSPWIQLVVMLAGAVLVGVFLGRRQAAIPTGFLFVELPMLLLVGEVYFGLAGRSAQDLAENPLNGGAQVKLVLIGVTLVIGALALATGPAHAPRVGTAFLLFAAYVVVVFLGVSASVDPSLTAFRGLELAAAVIAVAGAYRRLGREAVVRIERILYGALVALVGSVWLVLLVSPGRVLVPTPASPLPWELEGVYPAISSNGVGTLGLILALWSLGRMFEPIQGERMGRPAALLATALGVATLVGAQYRTGYIAFALGIAVLLVVRGRRTLAVVTLAVALAAALWGISGAVETSQPFLLRGDTTAQAGTLSGRLFMWRHAIPFWRESPVLGRGLLTSTRLEVLPSIGLEDTATVHGTWIEALVGTGLVGTTLLAAAVLVLLRRALADALRRGGRVVPALLVTALIVRSVTGGSVESLGLGVLLLLVLAVDLEARSFAPTRSASAPPRLASAQFGRS
jgi:O-antigen ligase